MTRSLEFASGALAAVAVSRLRCRTRAVGQGAVGGGLCAVAYCVVALDDSARFPGAVALLPVVGTLLILVGGHINPAGLFARLLSSRPACALGDISYSLYLWHWLFIVFAVGLWPTSREAKAVAAIISIVPAWLSYRYLENPIRRRPAPRTRNTLGIAAACLLVPLGAAYALQVVHRSLSNSDLFSPLALHADVTLGCDSSIPLGDRDPSMCSWSGSRPGGFAALVGDSQAGFLTEGFETATKDLGLGGSVTTYSGCPFVDLRLWDFGVDNQKCRDFVVGTVKALVRARPQVVLLGMWSDGYIGLPRFRLTSPDGFTSYDTPDEKAAAWRVGLSSIVDQLSAAGIRVVIMHPIPRLPAAWDPHRMAPLLLLDPERWATVSIDQEDALRPTRTATAVENDVARATGASVLDLTPQICPLAQCTAYDRGVWIYRDANHLSIAGSLLMADTLGGSLETESE